ncbi:ribonuclease T [Shewanella waksmanii]|uniref:ribonuclease T2 family protein n=1 Tax=Shewanella waksmanii TaxID=213783 RepID=UPI0037365ABD
MMTTYKHAAQIWLCSLPTLMFTLALTGQAWSAEINITQGCPLYQSKNKQTNPDDRQAQVADSFRVVQTLGPQSAPTWVRVDTKATPHPLRWIEAKCTNIAQNKPAISLNSQGASSNQCQIAQQYDSHVLALSWQAGFCATRGKQRKECQQANNQHPSASQFSLHGLWPNRQTCGISYGYCAKIRKQPSQFCDYPAINLTSQTRQQLQQLMPSAEFGTCLQRHEWWKHGSCRDQTPEQYYQLAIRLTEQVNQTSLVKEFIAKNRGKTVSRKQFNQAIDQSFGQNSYRHISLQCRHGQLVEIQMQLPKQLLGQPISSLLSTAKRARKGSCGQHFQIGQYPN